jgi:hypothetical protein
LPPGDDAANQQLRSPCQQKVGRPIPLAQVSVVDRGSRADRVRPVLLSSSQSNASRTLVRSMGMRLSGRRALRTQPRDRQGSRSERDGILPEASAPLSRLPACTSPGRACLKHGPALTMTYGTSPPHPFTPTSLRTAALPCIQMAAPLRCDNVELPQDLCGSPLQAAWCPEQFST